ncbi:peptidoglycan-binding protein [Streptomyces sp. NBC_01481]|uniref:peptidoglycan-binding domain-containing protein n=1 Tax=Streptomyces sp. NBC_01481 TaxID=2975869 RepID=UPI0022513043|nr:peptidoglycan-binding domain-containing protein [Streptomyces sp. NBC_01481]MCX4582434.1 peptidoglycan-binding protein [Streptomyces sp. NBC_01481]
MTGHQCPECGTPRDAQGRAGPGCACAERAADAVRAEREADAATAEDFDPLRVRPYVTLQNVAESGVAPDGGTVPLPRVVDAAPHDGPDALHPVTLDAVDLTPANLTPVRHRRRKRSYKGLVVAAAAVTVAGTAAFAGGLFSGDDDKEKALPDRGTVAPTVSRLPDAPTSGPTGSASADASASASGTASADPSTTSAASRDSSPADPASSTAQTTGSVSQAPQTQVSGTLRSGDSGAAVVDLQQRLAEVLLYVGPMDGEYDQSVADAVRAFQNTRHVKGDPKGVYGPKTRRALEAETN